MPTVRPATEADLDALATMGDSLARQHHAYDAGRFLYDDEFRDGYRWWFGQELGRDEVFLGVVDGADGPAGYVYGRVKGKDWNALLEAHAALVDVFVRPESRGSGAGEALVEAFCAWAVARGFPQVVLSTAAQNAGAQRLFAKLGFRPTMVELTRG